VNKNTPNPNHPQRSEREGQSEHKKQEKYSMSKGLRGKVKKRPAAELLMETSIPERAGSLPATCPS